MEGTLSDFTKDTQSKPKCKFDLRRLRKSLKYRPEILKLILKMRQCVRKKNLLLKQLKQQLKRKEQSLLKHESNSNSQPDNVQNTSSLSEKLDISNTICNRCSKANSKYNDCSTQTDDVISTNSHPVSKEDIVIENSTKDSTVDIQGDNEDSMGWKLNESEEGGKSIAEQVKEVAQSALQQTGMVFVESAGMYYDYKTGYYYNSELGLYYHTDTNCYYYYSEDKKELVFHSYPDRSVMAATASLDAHERRKARKQKKAQKKDEDVEDLTKNFSKDEEPKPKRKKTSSKTKKKTEDKQDKDVQNNEKIPKTDADTEIVIDVDKEVEETEEKQEDLEDGECSDTGSDEDAESDDSTSTVSNEDTVAKHHPPCMRLIVRETNLPKLKVGSLFLVTKDGGTIGREGDHAVLIRDTNVSRNHLDIAYDVDKRIYTATDLGSKNGTLLNGIQMSESQVVSKPMEILHGSIIQLGETKLLCHIHPGNDTCGHCEPGLIMETQEKEKAAYTRTCSVQKQHQLELARLKNKYAPEPLMIEDGAYKDRAKERRDAVGSSHHSEKTQTMNVDTAIAPENKGFKLLEKMGWSKGEGLGKDNQGETEPIPLVSNEGKAGLGTPGAVAAPNSNPVPRKINKLGSATLRLATKSKMLQPPAKAFQDEEEDD